MKNLNEVYQVEAGSIDGATYQPGPDDAHWVQYRAGDSRISLDGSFTREQLEFFLTLMPLDESGEPRAVAHATASYEQRKREMLSNPAFMSWLKLGFADDWEAEPLGWLLAMHDAWESGYSSGLADAPRG